MESSVKTASLLTRNRQRKQSHVRHWNLQWNMSDSWHMESTASKNSRPTRETDSKDIFIFDAWNRQTHYASADSEIDSENWVPVAREINFETDSRLTDGIDSASEFTVDERNQKIKDSHRWRMESWVKTSSLLTRNRQLKQSHFRPWNRHCNMSGSWRMESTASKNSRARRETSSKNKFLFDAWNRQTLYASADPEIVGENWVTVEREIMFETESRLTNGIDNAS
jgi:hypothetical protein